MLPFFSRITKKSKIMNRRWPFLHRNGKRAEYLCLPQDESVSATWIKRRKDNVEGAQKESHKRSEELSRALYNACPISPFSSLDNSMLRSFIVRAGQSDPIWIIVDLFLLFCFSLLSLSSRLALKLMHKKGQTSDGCNRIVGTRALPMG